jgi:hypothetical protein
MTIGGAALAATYVLARKYMGGSLRYLRNRLTRGGGEALGGAALAPGAIVQQLLLQDQAAGQAALGVLSNWRSASSEDWLRVLRLLGDQAGPTIEPAATPPPPSPIPDVEEPVESAPLRQRRRYPHDEL